MKKALALLALLAAVCGLLTFSAAAESAVVESGACGENLTWTLDAAGTLTVSGTGAMEDFGYKGAPWYQSCDSIKAVVIESGVTTIGERAFNDCGSLTGITIPEGVTTIGKYAFQGCESLTDVSITDLEAWCRIDFANYSATPMWYAKNIWLDGQKIVSVTMPEGVTEVKAYTFYGFKDLIQVIIPESVTTIGDRAFSDCSSLTGITIPEGVTAIGEYAFYGCDSLTDVFITDLEAWCRIDFANDSATPMQYAKNIWLDGQKLVSVVVPEGVTEVKAYTFYGFKDLIQVTIPKSVTTIGDYAFDSCSSLTGITIPEGVTTIGDWAFYGCSSLISITIPEGVTTIGDSMFSWCSSLTSITIPESVTAIGDSAFAWCRSLTGITIPEGVTSIGEEAFSGCSRLTSITIPEGVTAIGYSAFSGCRRLTDVSITDLVAWCNIAFGDEEANPLYEAENLYLNGELVETLEIPEGVAVIRQGLFRNAACIRRVALPKGLKGVAANAFYGCRKIQEVFYAGSEAEWKALPIAAGNDPLKNATIYYNSTLDDYYCRITVEVSEGGRVAVSANTVKAGDTVTVTATPYRGYALSAIYVDGAEISGDTFTVTGNHRVSAVFTRLPAVGGNEDFRLEGITVLDGAGNPLQELPAERLLVTVTVRHLKESGSGAVMLAQYDERGRYQGLLWLTLEEMPQDMTLKVTLPVDNTGGSIAQLKVFLVESLLSPAPVGEAISFGTI